MKNIFVPASGNNTDHAVFATALAAASPFGSHLQFYHQRLSVWVAAVRARHVEFCVAPALTDALANLGQQDAHLSANAAKHFNEFCSKHSIRVRQSPDATAAVTAADLLVIGGYGHGPLREAVFGGITAALIRHAECPVLMIH